MDKDVIKKLIVMSQEQDVKLVERDLEISFAGKINTITGPRRSGKTFFIYQKINQLKSENKDKIIYINFEDERLLPIEGEDLDLILESYYELYPENVGEKLYMFFDELQTVPF